MMKKILLILFALSLFFSVPKTFGQTPSESLKKWSEHKYSMFIHFGVYSKLGGVWKGQKVTVGYSEQIQAHAQGLYSDLYENEAAEFNPQNWDAEKIVRLAKDAGMKSIIITAKHHDGFSLWNTAQSDFNIVKYTPFKRDIIKELSEACQRQGMAFGLYFSLIDWHYPAATPITYYNVNSIPPAHHQFNLKQVEELLTNYGAISELWFDMGSLTFEQSRELRELVKKLQPNCLIGSRVGNNMGDFIVTGDNQQPDYIIGVPWQSPASMFDETWGYRSWQERGDVKRKIREKILSLINVTSRGGNFLLNIGPKGDGSVVDFEKEVLLSFGKWLKQNGEAIYGAQPDPFHKNFEWGFVTSKPQNIYLLVTQKTAAKISLPSVEGEIKSVRVLGESQKLQTALTSDGLEISLPADFISDDLPKVISIEFKNGYRTAPLNLRDENAVFTSRNAFPSFSHSGIDYWTDIVSTIKNAWTIRAQNTDSYTPVLTYGNFEKGKSLEIEIGAKKEIITLDGDREAKLNNDSANLKFGTMYQTGVWSSAISQLDGDIKNINVNQSWGKDKIQNWQAKPAYQNGKPFVLPAKLGESYYVLQEIESPQAQTVAVEIASTDGVGVYLNGEKIYVGNNLFQKESVQETIFLPLVKGKNQLVVKFFNRFQRQIKGNINFKVPQIYFEKTLSLVRFEKGSLYNLSWKLHNPPTPHEDLRTPNLSLIFKKK